MSERGSGSILAIGLCTLIVILCFVVADVAILLNARASAVTAADAAALAAAPVTFRPFGAAGTPAHEAALFARANDARLISCRCGVDPEWSARTVEVVVEATRPLVVFGRVSVRAASRAEFSPLLLQTRRADP